MQARKCEEGNNIIVMLFALFRAGSFSRQLGDNIDWILPRNFRATLMLLSVQLRKPNFRFIYFALKNKLTNTCVLRQSENTLMSISLCGFHDFCA